MTEWMEQRQVERGRQEHSIVIVHSIAGSKTFKKYILFCFASALAISGWLISDRHHWSGCWRIWRSGGICSMRSFKHDKKCSVVHRGGKNRVMGNGDWVEGQMVKQVEGISRKVQSDKGEDKHLEFDVMGRLLQWRNASVCPWVRQQHFEGQMVYIRT